MARTIRKATAVKVSPAVKASAMESTGTLYRVVLSRRADQEDADNALRAAFIEFAYSVSDAVKATVQVKDICASLRAIHGTDVPKFLANVVVKSPSAVAYVGLTGDVLRLDGDAEMEPTAIKSLIKRTVAAVGDGGMGTVRGAIHAATDQPSAIAALDAIKATADAKRATNGDGGRSIVTDDDDDDDATDAPTVASLVAALADLIADGHDVDPDSLSVLLSIVQAETASV